MDPPLILPPNIDDVPPPGLALVLELDKPLLVQLRDGRKVVGTLRSFDQFANLVLEGKEREGLEKGLAFIRLVLGCLFAAALDVVTELAIPYSHLSCSRCMPLHTFKCTACDMPPHPPMHRRLRAHHCGKSVCRDPDGSPCDPRRECGLAGGHQPGSRPAGWPGKGTRDGLANLKTAAHSVINLCMCVCANGTHAVPSCPLVCGRRLVAPAANSVCALLQFSGVRGGDQEHPTSGQGGRADEGDVQVCI